MKENATATTKAPEEPADPIADGTASGRDSAARKRSRGEGGAKAVLGRLNTRFWILSAAFILILALCVRDAIVAGSGDGSHTEVYGQPGHAGYEWQLSFSEMRMERHRSRAVGRMRLTIVGPDDNAIEEFQLGLQTAEDGSTPLYNYPDSNVEKSWKELFVGQRGDENRRQDVLETELSEFPVHVNIVRNAALFPFDKADIKLSPRLCANSESGVCFKPGNSQLRSMSIYWPDSTLSVDCSNLGENITCEVGRRLSVILTTCILMIVAIVLLARVFMSRSATTTIPDAIALFAGLWAFRSVAVPQNLSNSVNLVDFTLLAVFVMVLISIVTREEAHESTKTE